MTKPSISLSQLKSLINKVRIRKFIAVKFHLHLHDTEKFYDITILTLPSNTDTDPKFTYLTIPDLTDSETFNYFVKDFKNDECCYIVYDFEFVKKLYNVSNGGMILVSYVPENACMTSKTVYSFNSLKLREAFEVPRIVTINSRVEINCENVVVKSYGSRAINKDL